jgi:microcystin degradation protein MlrC
VQHARRFPFLIPINAQSTWMEPARSLYDELVALDREHGTVSSFCMGFPASDFDECAPMIWSHGERAERVADALFARASEPTQWRESLLAPRDAAAQAIALAANAPLPVVIADTQDNPGAGGDSNTTGMLHALVAQGAGKRYPGRVALGMMYDRAAAKAAHEAGVGSEIHIALGTAVPTFAGMSDAPLSGRFKVVSLSDGVCTLRGPMMTGLTVRLGPSACLEIDGVRVAVVSGKKQLLDRALLHMVGIEHEQMRIVVVKSSNHFRADFQPHASHVLVAKAIGPMAADPSDLPWRKLPAAMRRRP